MADDDLDAFFDEVSEVEAKAVQGDAQTKTKAANEDEGTAEPPAKKAKTSAPMRPRGVVVASSTSVVIPAKEREEKAAELLEASLQPSSGRPTIQQGLSSFSPPSSSNNNSNNNTSQANSSIGPAFPAAQLINTQQQHQQQQQQGKKKGASVRMAAGQKWVDNTLDEWPENDFRIFVGNLSNEVSDLMLLQHFSKYPSLAKAKVVRHNNNPEKSKGYGFVSLLDPLECARALREMDQTWLASRPIRIKRSDWKERDFKVVKKREKKEKKQLRYR